MFWLCFRQFLLCQEAMPFKASIPSIVLPSLTPPNLWLVLQLNSGQHNHTHTNSITQTYAHFYIHMYAHQFIHTNVNSLNYTCFFSFSHTKAYARMYKHTHIFKLPSILSVTLTPMHSINLEPSNSVSLTAVHSITLTPTHSVTQTPNHVVKQTSFFLTDRGVNPCGFACLCNGD